MGQSSEAALGNCFCLMKRYFLRVKKLYKQKQKYKSVVYKEGGISRLILRCNPFALNLRVGNRFSF